MKSSILWSAEYASLRKNQLFSIVVIAPAQVAPIRYYNPKITFARFARCISVEQPRFLLIEQSSQI